MQSQAASHQIYGSLVVTFTDQHSIGSPQTLPLDATSLERLKQLRSLLQQLFSLHIAHPHPLPLMLLRPAILLLLDSHLVESVRRAWRLWILPNLRLGALLLNRTEVLFNPAFNTGFFPCFATCCFLLRAFVGLPASFRQNPSFAGGALNE